MADDHHHTSRRDFFRRSFGSVLAGASVFEEAFLRAGWARAQAQTAPANLFDIEKVADGVFAALAKPAALTNCNAAIFVLSRDVLVVDAHSKPSAAASLIAQIKKEVTDKVCLEQSARSGLRGPLLVRRGFRNSYPGLSP